MFTGLIEATGAIAERKGSRVVLSAPSSIVARLRLGDSVAVNGVCLTALDLKKDSFAADLAAETLARTTLGRLAAGTVVNLELPTAAGAPLGGHVVQGHVDGVGELISLDFLDPDWRLKVRVPGELARYVMAQGSIAIEGISLTVAAVAGETVEVAIIPHTYSATNLHTLAAGAKVNIETDVLGKYAERRESTLTEASLIARGY